MDELQEKLKTDLRRLLKGFEEANEEIKNKLSSGEEITEGFLLRIQEIVNKPMSELYYEYLDEKYESGKDYIFDTSLIIHDPPNETEPEDDDLFSNPFMRGYLEGYNFFNSFNKKGKNE